MHHICHNNQNSYVRGSTPLGIWRSTWEEVAGVCQLVSVGALPGVAHTHHTPHTAHHSHHATCHALFAYRICLLQERPKIRNSKPRWKIKRKIKEKARAAAGCSWLQLQLQKVERGFHSPGWGRLRLRLLVPLQIPHQIQIQIPIPLPVRFPIPFPCQSAIIYDYARAPVSWVSVRSARSCRCASYASVPDCTRTGVWPHSAADPAGPHPRHRSCTRIGWSGPCSASGSRGSRTTASGAVRSRNSRRWPRCQRNLKELEKICKKFL